MPSAAFIGIAPLEIMADITIEKSYLPEIAWSAIVVDIFDATFLDNMCIKFEEKPCNKLFNEPLKKIVVMSLFWHLEIT